MNAPANLPLVADPIDPEAIETPAEASLHRAWLADLAEQAEERDRRGWGREWKPTRTVRP